MLKRKRLLTKILTAKKIHLVLNNIKKNIFKKLRTRFEYNIILFSDNFWTMSLQKIYRQKKMAKFRCSIVILLNSISFYFFLLQIFKNVFVFCLLTWRRDILKHIGFHQRNEK